MTIGKYFSLKMPEIDLLGEKEMLGDAIRIKSADSKEERLAMHKMALFFKREFHYDAVQYAAFYDKEDDKECHAYLWTVEKQNTKIKSVVIGGFCFRLREWGGYGLQWIWIHPYLRNTGLLTRHWDILEEKFGKDFHVEPPLSFAMYKFMHKRGNNLHIIDRDVPNLFESRHKLKK